MLIRTKILPRSWADAGVTIFLLVMSPTVLWFHLCVVIPTYHEVWSFWYNFNLILATLVFINIAANYTAMVICNTSIKGRLMPMGQQPDWKYCAVCESPAPPRSWHCSVCNICILKRDHHCMFSSCCIGHYNNRYFLMFVLYMFLGTAYVVVYDTSFISSRVDLSTFLSLCKILFPIAMLIVNHSVDQTYLLCYIIVLVTCAFSGTLLVFHINLVLNGRTTHERKHHARLYDLGKMENIKGVLGEHWYLVWISPFITSKLPSDGITWTVADFTKTD